jgi:2,5-diamino-6-(ribosylamino)-4(3H)-pyrimidinone 5'-phosphate reductase
VASAAPAALNGIDVPPVGRPHVVVHVAASVDGATAGFDPDVGRFYALVPTWEEDVTLVGADTILAQEEALAAVPRPGPAPDGPLLAVVDGRGRVREWEALRDCGSWSGVLALRAGAAAASAGDTPVRELVTGTERVDLAAALGALWERGARLVRVDSGGSLIGALLRDGLVDELSLLVHPCVTGAPSDRRWHGSAPAPAPTLERLACEPFDDGLVWLRYRIIGADGRARQVAPAPTRVAKSHSGTGDSSSQGTRRG